MFEQEEFTIERSFDMSDREVTNLNSSFNLSRSHKSFEFEEEDPKPSYNV